MYSQINKARACIVRLEESSQGAIGALLVDGKVLGLTLEPDSKDPEKPQIPMGIYTCTRFHGAKFKDTFEILIHGHTAVLFHPGNTEEDTTMCVLMGSKVGYLKGDRAVLNSGATFRAFMEHFKDVDEFVLAVFEFIPKGSYIPVDEVV